MVTVVAIRCMECGFDHTSADFFTCITLISGQCDNVRYMRDISVQIQAWTCFSIPLSIIYLFHCTERVYNSGEARKYEKHSVSSWIKVFLQKWNINCEMKSVFACLFATIAACGEKHPLTGWFHRPCNVIFILIYLWVLVLVLVLPTTKEYQTCWRRHVDGLPKYHPPLVTDWMPYGRSTRKCRIVC